MTLKTFPDRVKTTTATTGTGTLTLGAAATQFRAGFAAMDGLLCDYILLDVNGTAWETGLGTYTHSGTTLSRGVIASSNSNAAISLSGSGSTVIIGPVANNAADSYAAQRGHIRGGVLNDASTTTISCTAVSAFIESDNRVYDFDAPATITRTSSGGAGGVRHIYLTNAGVLEDSATAPVLFAGRAAGNARSKSGDASRRYLGSYAQDTSNNIVPFTMQEQSPGVAKVHFSSCNGASPHRVLNGGTNAAYSTITSFASLVPADVVTKITAIIQGYGGASSVQPVSISTDGTNNNVAVFYTNGASGAGISGEFDLATATPGIYYKNGATTPTTYIDLTGYTFTR